jgi:hypothetical protein
MTINNSDDLNALERMIDSSNIQETKVGLTEEQKIMLTISDADIKSRRTIQQDSLNKQELEWLAEK